MPIGSFYFRTALNTVTPLVAIMIFLELFIGALGTGAVLDLIAGAVMVTAGLILFLQGVDVALIPLARMIGAEFPQRTSLAVVVILAFFIALVINVSDPAVRILAAHVKNVPADSHLDPALLILTIASGIAGFICLGLVRVLVGVSLKVVFATGWCLVLALSFFVPEQFLPIAFDAGGFATGPLTVPFILAFGLGFVTVLGKATDDGFGMLGLAALGPVLGVMLLGVLFL
jgi:hypothetical protein